MSGKRCFQSFGVNRACFRDSLARISAVLLTGKLPCKTSFAGGGGSMGFDLLDLTTHVSRALASEAELSSLRASLG